ncbi:MAG: flagellar hook-associated protein FlgL [Pseudomonadota bacterium]|nr:flagellar hook-associated protein FlgL [Pseudomonadota bacterium]
MRISHNQMFRTALAGIQQQQSRLSVTEQQLVYGKKLLSPADDPTAAARAITLRQSINDLVQLNRNADIAEAALQLSDQTLGEIQSLLESIRTVALDAFNGSNSAVDFQDFGIDLAEKLDFLLDLGNSRDGSGNYLFSGSRQQVPPFVANADGTYGWQGDQQEQSLRVGPSRVLKLLPSGFDLFASVPTGNGTVSSAHDSSNLGSGLLGTVTMNGTGYDGADYEIVFSGPDAYDVVNVTTGATVATAQPFEAGATISFAGIDVVIEGAPEAGDRFSFGPSAQRNVLETVRQLTETLQGADGSNETDIYNTLTRSIEDLDRAMERVELLQVRAGNRLAVLDDIRAANETFDLRYREQLSLLEDLDMVEAASLLTAQADALEIAQAAFARIQGLSLFNFI